ncbi:MAG TPA: nuclear transport factor 2 family protein [Dokdonella sp.]|nr:nuclear transport factor 2 family protein [Dokdonella sp.]
MTLAFDPTRLGDVIDIMYAMISGPAGPRDWSVQDRIFHPDARQMRTGVDEHGKPWIKIMNLDDYAADTTPFFATNDFFEIELSRRIEEFGNMAQVWSVYEARNSPGEGKPERRGINSIQLYRNEAGHWQIMSMIWDNERPGNSIDRFL